MTVSIASIQHVSEHCGDAGEPSHPMAFNGFKHLFELESLQDDHAPPGAQTTEYGTGNAENVYQRQNGDRDVIFPQAVILRSVGASETEIAVC